MEKKKFNTVWREYIHVDDSNCLYDIYIIKIKDSMIKFSQTSKLAKFVYEKFQINYLTRPHWYIN